MTRLFPSRDDQVPSCYLYCLSSTSKQQTSSTIVFRRRRTFFHILEMQDPFILSTGASSCNLVIFDKSSHLSSKYSFFLPFFIWRSQPGQYAPRICFNEDAIIHGATRVLGTLEGQLILGIFIFEVSTKHSSAYNLLHFSITPTKIDL